jgi:polyferredoxin
MNGMLQRIDLTRAGPLRVVLLDRWPQFLLVVALLVGFVLAIVAGLAGTPVGNHNFGIVFTWIGWWAVLILVAVPFFGRGWCAVCPIPAPGEWLQRGALLQPGERPAKFLSLRWPRRLRNMWLQNATFTLVALFSSVILTTPSVTGIVLAAMLFGAVGLSMIYERRAFCRYLCPVGGFIGLYAQAAPLELRVRDTRTCVTCAGKPCYNGSAAGYGCPWLVFPGGLKKNNYCGLCMECLRTCPHDNISVNLRPFAADLSAPTRRLDEAFKAFIMVGSALIYAAILLGPWGVLKDAAYRVGSSPWWTYAVVFLALLFVVLPGLHALAVKSGMLMAGQSRPLKAPFAAFASAFIPIGLLFWIAFSFSFVLTNATYISITASDPFGWGWNLFGTALASWQPLLISWLIPAQTLCLVGGMLWSGQSAHRVGRELGINAVPVIALSLALTLLMMGLLL